MSSCYSLIVVVILQLYATTIRVMKENTTYLFRSTWAQWSKGSPVPSCGSSVQLGENVASNIAMVESKRLQVSRNSVSWQPHSSTTSAEKRIDRQTLLENWINKCSIFVREFIYETGIDWLSWIYHWCNVPFCIESLVHKCSMFLNIHDRSLTNRCN